MDIKQEFDSKSKTDDVFDVKVKEEPELIIGDDDEWRPKEEHEYYQEFFGDSSQMFVKDESGFETYKIQFLDESENYVDDESDFYSDGDNDYESCDEDFDILRKYAEDLDDSKTPNKLKVKYSDVHKQINRWLSANFVEYMCPECTELFSKYRELRKHLEETHKELIVETEKRYFVGSVCKECNKKCLTMSFRYFHSMKHDKNYAKQEINICKVCSFKAKRTFFVQKHILENHREVIKDFKINVKMNCPICFSSYKNHTQMIHHFMDKHSSEHKAEIIFNCHLCVHEAFNMEQSYLQHLAEIHELNSWQILNFRQIVEDRECFACTKCLSLLVEADPFKLLKHFLKHEDNSFWTCRFCSKKFSFQKDPVHHMCLELIEHCNDHKYNANSIDKCLERREGRIKNLQEFEMYIAHVCPFCNKEFSKMLKWHQHLKKDHAIETLKGLEMKKLVNDTNKLFCVICHALVANSPEKLNAHRFQHLPFKPYKCISCSCILSTFKMAVNHVSNQCKEEDDRKFVKNVDDSVSDIRAYMEIRCTICNDKKFNDVLSSFKHYKDEHNNFEEFFIKNSDNSVTCKVCTKHFMRNNCRNRCVLHLISHFDEKTFQCKLCLQSYAALKSMHHHFLSHPKTRSYYQQSCKKNVQKTVSLHDKGDRAAANVTSLAVSSIKSHVLNEFAEFIAFVCPECNEGMGSQQMWQDHIVAHHNFFNKSEIYVKDLDGSIKCTTCKMKLPTSITQQQKHKLTHMPYKSFMCNLCYVRCNSLGILYSHFRRKHFAKGSFDCPLCPEISETSYHRSKHLKDKHPREKWPKSMCLICYQILKSNTGLRIHMKVHDIDRVKYTCEICSAKIIELKDFNIHVERHKKRGEVNDKFNDDMPSSSKSEDDQSNDISSKITELKNVTKKHKMKGEVKDKFYDDMTSSSKSEGGQSNDIHMQTNFFQKCENNYQENKIEKQVNKNFMRSQVTLNKYLENDHTVAFPSIKKKKEDDQSNDISYKIAELKNVNISTKKHKKTGEVKDKFNDDMNSSSKSEDGQSNDIHLQTKVLEKCQNKYQENENEKKVNKNFMRSQVMLNKYLENDHTVAFPSIKTKKDDKSNDISSKITELKNVNIHKKKVQVKDKFNDDMTSSSKSEDGQSIDIQVQTKSLEKCQNYQEKGNEKKVNKNFMRSQIMLNKYLENDHTAAFPSIKKKKYTSEEF